MKVIRRFSLDQLPETARAPTGSRQSALGGLKGKIATKAHSSIGVSRGRVLR